MSEVKPVYQRHIQYDEWMDITEEEWNHDSLRGKYKTRVLYSGKRCRVAISDKQIDKAAKRVHLTNDVDEFELRQFVDALLKEVNHE